MKVTCVFGKEKTLSSVPPMHACTVIRKDHRLLYGSILLGNKSHFLRNLRVCARTRHYMIVRCFYLLKIKEIKKNMVLVTIIEGPTGIPVKLEPKIPRVQARLPDIIPP
jgi:hypothetical protein